ncbi:MAG: hypothetical protein RIK87_16465 [Fuerstiella sp.]
MRAILISGVLIAVMVFLGWLTFASGDGSASVTLDTDEVKKDTAAAVEKSKELVEEGKQLLQEVQEETQPEEAPADKQQ